MEKFRIEHDTMGEVKVPADRYWGAQTQRSFQNFKIGKTKMPKEIIDAFAILKKAAATTNCQFGVLDSERANLISTVCDEILDGKLEGNFPLVVYQTGSGTQSNMNVNEVITGRGNEIAGKKILHPNDHVNKSQSSNDTFPTAMHIAGLTATEDRLLPAAKILHDTLLASEKKFAGIVKTGRTHLQDATPLTLGQEISGWRSMISHDIYMIESGLSHLRELALGGTAVGTGLNAPENFDEIVAEEISALTGKPFRTAGNKFHSLTSKAPFVFAHGSIKALAMDLFKIANDIRLLASGPRCGIGELIIPANEPGSSIMPGKVNPTQCEALTMVCSQVIGNDTTISFASSQGHYQLNVFMPVIIHNYLESVNLLSDAIISFSENCVQGIKPNEKQIQNNLEKSLMLVTALNPHIGYENAAKIAKEAYISGKTLKEAAVSLGLVSPADFDVWVEPEKMI